MSSEAADAIRALRPMRERLVSVPDAEVLEARRARVLPALSNTVRAVPSQRARARRRRTSWLVAAAAAAVVGLVAPGVYWGGRRGEPALDPVTLSALSGSVEHRGEGAVRVLGPGETIASRPSSEIRTGVAARARLEGGGTLIELGERSTLSLAELGAEAGARSRVELRAGSIRCAVSPRSGAGRFSVVTPDAVVTVHGTVFSVSVSGAPERSASSADRSGRTCVRVESGVVSVEHAGRLQRLASNQSWGCARRDEAPSRSSAARLSGSSPPAPASSAPVQAGARGRPRGTLAEENRLLEAGLAAERRGQVDSAIEIFNDLLARYPRSPLATDARAALARLREPRR